MRFYLNPVVRREWSEAGRAAIAARYAGMAWIAPEWPLTIHNAVRRFANGSGWASFSTRPDERLED